MADARTDDASTDAAAYPAEARVLVVGAGAIGGLLGVRLSQRGHVVTFLARGKHLAAMRAAGALKLVSPDGTESVSGSHSSFVGHLNEVHEPYDIVILGLKTHQIAAVLPDLSRALHERSVLVTTQNGIPWWYFQRYAGPAQHLCGRTIDAVDPGGTLAAGIDPKRLLATVVYPAARVGAPGTIVHESGVRFPLGELDGSESARATWVSGLLVDAGFKSPVLPDVRAELWLKAWGTTAVNPLSALTHAPLDALCGADGPGRAVVEGVMREVETVAHALGATMRVPMQRRVDGARDVGPHKTSMLQDVETGRAPEVDTIVGAVVELARLADVDTPRLDTVYGCVRMLDEMLRRRGGEAGGDGARARVRLEGGAG